MTSKYCSILVAQSIEQLYTRAEYPERDEEQLSSSALEGLLSNTPNFKQGDIAIPMFFLSKMFKENPKSIAERVSKHINDFLAQEKSAKDSVFSCIERTEADGFYLNFFLERSLASKEVLQKIQDEGDSFGSGQTLAGQRIMIEFSGPNTNKPLHVGHLRNNVLGESMSRILSFAGADVFRVNIINDRGVHICKSMLAYQMYGNGETPQSKNQKPDHFVGDYYILYMKWAENNAEAEAKIADMLRRWEEKDQELRALWKQMNAWTIQGIQETYARTDIHFDKIYYESETYEFGRDKILEGLDAGVFYKDEDGSVKLSLEEIGLDTKVVLRSDGTSLYITQDVGTAYMRYQDWSYDSAIYVVAHEQSYHFKALFHLLEKLDFSPAVQKQMLHLQYGMVHLPDGKMKSREGKIVDADQLIDSTEALVRSEIEKRERLDAQHVADVAHKVALGAIHYYLLHVGSKKDILFHPQKSISFTGNTGPYLQYSCARIASILRKHGKRAEHELAWTHTVEDLEWGVILQLDGFSQVIVQVVQANDPSQLAKYLYDLASDFARYYHDIHVLGEKNEELKRDRLALCSAVLQVLKTGLRLLCIPYLERM